MLQKWCLTWQNIKTHCLHNSILLPVLGKDKKSQWPEVQGACNRQKWYLSGNVWYIISFYDCTVYIYVKADSQIQYNLIS